jgi:hypothetical protein
LRFIKVGPGQPSIAAQCRWKAQGATGFQRSSRRYGAVAFSFEESLARHAALEHDPEKRKPVFPRDISGTRLRGDHAQTKR